MDKSMFLSAKSRACLAFGSAAAFIGATIPLASAQVATITPAGYAIPAGTAAALADSADTTILPAIIGFLTQTEVIFVLGVFVGFLIVMSAIHWAKRKLHFK